MKHSKLKRFYNSNVVFIIGPFMLAICFAMFWFSCWFAPLWIPSMLFPVSVSLIVTIITMLGLSELYLLQVDIKDTYNEIDTLEFEIAQLNEKDKK